MLTTACFVILIIMINSILWFLYRRDLAGEIAILRLQLQNASVVNRNLMVYIDELQRRAESLRQARNTEMLAARMRTEPVERVYPVQPFNISTSDN